MRYENIFLGGSNNNLLKNTYTILAVADRDRYMIEVNVCLQISEWGIIFKPESIFQKFS
jgi:hypothetical protein